MVTNDMMIFFVKNFNILNNKWGLSLLALIPYPNYFRHIIRMEPSVRESDFYFALRWHSHYALICHKDFWSGLVKEILSTKISTTFYKDSGGDI